MYYHPTLFLLVGMGPTHYNTTIRTTNSCCCCCCCCRFDVTAALCCYCRFDVTASFCYTCTCNEVRMLLLLTYERWYYHHSLSPRRDGFHTLPIPRSVRIIRVLLLLLPFRRYRFLLFAATAEEEEDDDNDDHVAVSFCFLMLYQATLYRSSSLSPSTTSSSRFDITTIVFLLVY